MNGLYVGCLAEAGGLVHLIKDHTFTCWDALCGEKFSSYRRTLPLADGVITCMRCLASRGVDWNALLAWTERTQ